MLDKRIRTFDEPELATLPKLHWLNHKRTQSLIGFVATIAKENPHNRLIAPSPRPLPGALTLQTRSGNSASRAAAADNASHLYADAHERSRRKQTIGTND